MLVKQRNKPAQRRLPGAVQPDCREVLGVTIIPHTYQNTTLGTHKPGDRVNLECDVLAKHLEKLLESLEYFGKR